MDIDTNENGSISIESLIVLPIIFIISIILIQLIVYFKVSDQVMFNVVNRMVKNQIVEYEKELIEKELYEKYKSNNIKEGFDEILNFNLESNSNESINIKNDKISDYKEKIIYENENLIVEVSYNFIFPFSIFNNGKINNNEKKIIKTLKSGVSLKDYEFISNKIESKYDVWKLSNLKRAQEISKMLGGTVDFNGNTIDKIENGKIISIVSLDVRKETYQTSENIINKIKGDIKKLEDFKEGNVDGLWVNKEDYNAKILELVIPDVELNEEIKIQLLRVRNYCKNRNLEFKVVALTGG